MYVVRCDMLQKVISQKISNLLLLSLESIFIVYYVEYFDLIRQVNQCMVLGCNIESIIIYAEGLKGILDVIYNLRVVILLEDAVK